MLGKPKNRLEAFGIHIGISAIIFIILAAIIVFVWYPGFLFSTDGGWAGIRLVAGVDFIIGPTLTLIIYKAGKKGLVFDLVFIAIVQAVCLVAGTRIVYQERPLGIIFVDGEFKTMSKQSFDFHDINVKDVLALDNRVPAWIYVDTEQQQTGKKLSLGEMLNQTPVHARIDLYRKYSDNLEKIMQQAVKPDKLDENIRDNISKNGKIFPYTARYGYGFIEIDSTNGEYISIH